MVHIKQPPGSALCGQAVLAMAGQVSLDRAIEVIGHDGATTTKEIVGGLRTLGIGCANRLKVCKRNMPVFPKRCVVAMRNKQETRWHWVLMWDGQLYDPGSGQGSDNGWKMTSYLEIYS